MKSPLVSIIIPVYNGANYMQQAIDSALTQTYPNIEVLVINDGSRDEGATEAIAHAYGERIRYFEKENGGVSSALNMGIQNMRGEYFSWLSHDDLYEPDKVEKQVAYLNQVGKDTLLCCQYTQIDANSQPMYGYKPIPMFQPEVCYDWRQALSGLLKKSTVHGCCMLIPKNAFEKSGMFPENLRFFQDTVMWYTIFLHGFSLFYTPDVSVKSRIHAKQLTQTGRSLFKQDCEKMADDLMQKFADASTEEYNFLKMYLFAYAKFLSLEKVRGMIALGRKRGLLSVAAAGKAYLGYGYGKIRPILRNIYYGVFRRIQTG